MSLNSRKAAVHALCGYAVSDDESDVIIDNLLSDPNAVKKFGVASKDKKDSSRELYYGVLSRLITFEFIVGRFGSVPLRNMSSRAFFAASSGLYSLLYGHNGSKSVIEECVGLCAEDERGIVESLLRQVYRSTGNTFTKSKIAIVTDMLSGKNSATDTESFITGLFDKTPSKLTAFSRLYSYPEWLLKLWANYFDNERLLPIIKATLKTPETFIQFNTLKKPHYNIIEDLNDEDADCVKVETVRGLSTCYRVRGHFPYSDLVSYRNGEYYAMSFGMQVLCKLITPKFNSTILVLNAGDGSAAFSLSQATGGRNGKVIAVDPNPYNVQYIAEAADRLDLANVVVANYACDEFQHTLPRADTVLCIAPSSCFGQIGLDPRIKYADYTDYPDLSQVQYKLLSTAAQYVKAGGVLAYCTNTLNYNENETVTSQFSSQHREFSQKNVAPSIMTDPSLRDIPDYNLFSNNRINSEYCLTPDLTPEGGVFFSIFTRIH
jgi:16S rRNA (cytosine967-C5)-methyltransferase